MESLQVPTKGKVCVCAYMYIFTLYYCNGAWMMHTVCSYTGSTQQKLGVVLTLVWSVSYSDEITVARSHIHTLAQHSLHTTT